MAECFIRPHWFPILACAIIPSTFIVTYIIAVLLGHISADFPYISDTGTKAPESCIFGQFINIGAVFVGITFFIRYKQVEELIRDNAGRHLLNLNKAAFYVGLLSALGMSMVANFQETSVLVVHLIGAVMAFGLGTIYAWMHTIISFHMCPHNVSKFLCILRTVLCVISTLTFIGTFLFDALAKKQFHGDDIHKWHPGDGGFTLHIISTASEWTMALSFLIFFLTLVPELKPFSLSVPEVTMVIMRTESLSGLYTGGTEEL